MDGKMDGGRGGGRGGGGMVVGCMDGMMGRWIDGGTERRKEGWWMERQMEGCMLTTAGCTLGSKQTMVCKDWCSCHPRGVYSIVGGIGIIQINTERNVRHHPRGSELVGETRKGFHDRAS